MSHVHRLLVLVPVLFLVGCGGSRAEVVADAAPDEVEERTAEADGEPASGVALPQSSAAGVVVDVAGGVRRPGVYRLDPGARVHEAIQAAGGVRRGAQLGGLNRAAVLVDGQQVLVLGPGGATGGASAAEGGGTPTSAAAGGAVAGSSGAVGGTLVNINSADAAELDALPGIGEVTAERIVADRQASGPYASVDDLDRVPGIGPATIETLRSAATA